MAAFEMMGRAGLRPGEAYTLAPGDLDLVERTVRVERALDLDGTVKPTKTYETRTVRLSTSHVLALRRYLPWLKRETLKRGWSAPTWLFPSETNTPLDYSKATKVFRRALKAAELPDHRVYDLRHTYASLMLSAGAPLVFVSAQLGHKTPATTLKYYARWIPSDGDRWADILEPNLGTNADVAAEWDAELADLIGESTGAGGGSRTRDLLITNQLLCL